MAELVATRAARRRIPSARSWAGVAWSVDASVWNGFPKWSTVAIGCVLVASLSLAAWGFRPSVAPKGEDRTVWIEEPPRAIPAPVEPARAAPEPVSQAPAAAPIPPVRTPEAPPATEPVFGLDDAVSTGGLAVASGSTLATAPEPDPPPVPTRAASAGPMELATVPASVHPVVPAYPPRAEARGIESRVVVLVTTDTAGNVVSLRIESSGGRDFDEAVRRAVLATRFQVPRREGRALAVAFRMPYDFRLE